MREHLDQRGAVRLLMLLTAALLLFSGAMLSTRDRAAVETAAAALEHETIPEDYTPNRGTSQENEETSYVVRLAGGKLGVYPAGSDEPVLTSPAQAYLLPAADLALLRAGIPAESLAQARAILEDYE